MRNKLSIYCGFISLSFSLITLALFFVKVKASSVVDISTFIGVMGAFIGISVTLLIGYQIFNVLDFRNKLSQLESLRKELEHLREETNSINLQQQEGFNIILARLYHKDCLQTLNAVLSLMQAIPYSLSMPQKAEGYTWLLDELKEYMLEVTMVSFGSGTPEFFKKAVKEFKSIFDPIDNEIKEHQNFIYIKDKYTQLIDDFNIRLHNIATFKNVDLTEMTKAIPFPDYKYDD